MQYWMSGTQMVAKNEKKSTLRALHTHIGILIMLANRIDIRQNCDENCVISHSYWSQ